jgi:hypothetical protein
MTPTTPENHAMKGGSRVLLDHTTGPAGSRTPSSEGSSERDVAELRLVCLVRAGDGYVVRAAGRLAARGRSRAHLDIAFGDAIGGCTDELETAVRHIQRWCDDGQTVSLLDSGSRLTLRSRDGTAVRLPRSA